MGVFDLIFPQVCVACGSLGPRVCNDCVKKARHIEKDWCLGCGNEEETTTPCIYCFGKKHTLRVFGFWFYESIISRAIWSLKYKNDKHIVTELFHLTNPHTLSRLFLLQEQYTNPVLVPIPLHTDKERERGYNQALYIAKTLEIFTGIRVEDSAMRRAKKTKPQAHCKSRTERAQNIEGAFEVTRAEVLRGRTVLLVDDVTTTGATAQEAALALRRHRLSAPHLLCLAREKTH